VMTAVAAMPPFMTEDAGELTRLNSWIEGATSAGFIIGPGVGALLAAYASLDWVFVLDAVTSLVALPLIWPVRLRKPERAEGERPSPLAELRDGLRVSYSSRGLRYTVLMGTAMWLGFGAFGALEPLFFRDIVRTGIETIGWVNVLFGIGMVAGAALLPRLPSRIVSSRGLALIAALMGLGAILYVGTRDLRVVAAGSIAWGVVIGVADPLLRTLLQADSPDELVGRITGTAQMHRQAGELLPLAVAPALAARFGVQATLIGGGLVLSALAALSWSEAARVDRTGHLRHVEPSGAAHDPIVPGG
jgi:DHA3 family macrolide efflux protein-like MFS transporter